jgi:hypothetical protein
MGQLVEDPGGVFVQSRAIKKLQMVRLEKRLAMLIVPLPGNSGGGGRRFVTLSLDSIISISIAIIVIVDLKPVKVGCSQGALLCVTRKWRGQPPCGRGSQVSTGASLPTAANDFLLSSLLQQHSMLHQRLDWLDRLAS